MPLLAWIALTGCAPDLPDRPLVVIARAPDGSYGLEGRTIERLADPVRLDGDLTRGFAGGTLMVDGYRDGAPLRIDAVDTDAGLVPVDEDGLVLWSFAAHLTDTVDALDARGYDTRPIFPVDVAFSPASFMDFAAVENAAYVLGQRAFIVFPDAFDEVPLAANAGVVRHEFGHAWFELLASGESGGEIPWLDASVNDALAIRSLNEGFADTVAALLLDDPRFIDASLPMPSRDLTTDVVATGLYPAVSDTDVFGALTYDPYALGTVYASLAWDVREATDPDTALALSVAAIGAWGAEEAWDDADRYVAIVTELATGDAKVAACAAAAARFPHVATDCP